MKVIAVDVGFSNVKVINGDSVVFPSVVGTPEPSGTFSLGNDDGLAVRFDDYGAYTPVGNTALLQSRYTSGAREPGWVLENEWNTLLVAALGSLFDGPYDEIGLVTGLPVSDWKRYKELLKANLKGHSFSFQMKGRPRQDIKLVDVAIATQPYGTLAELMMDEHGRLTNSVWSTGRVLVIDIGGLTMNLLAIDGQRVIGQYSLSDKFGLLPVLDGVASRIRRDLDRFNPSTHEVAEYLARGSFRYRGNEVNIAKYADELLDPFIRKLSDRIDEAQPEGGRFDAVALSGGGASAIGEKLAERLKRNYANVEVLDAPRWANVRGYYKIGLSLWEND